jgi:hypothetical protein
MIIVASAAFCSPPLQSLVCGQENSPEDTKQIEKK